MAVGHITLNVSDFERSRGFYDRLMTQLEVSTRVVHDDDDTKIVAYQVPGCPLYLRWVSGEKSEPFVRNVGLDHICLMVKDRDAVDEIWHLLQREQAVVTRPPAAYPEYTDSYYAVYFRDPDGTPLEIACV